MGCVCDVTVELAIDARSGHGLSRPDHADHDDLAVLDRVIGESLDGDEEFSSAASPPASSGPVIWAFAESATVIEP